MAKLLEEVEVKLEWDDVRTFRTRPKLDRSPGIHLSGILRYVAIEMDMLKTGMVDKEDLEDPDIKPLRMALGEAWEEYCVSLYKNIRWQPGELYRNEVVGSPDGFENDWKLGAIIHEFKFTYKSANKDKKPRDILKDWMWISQAKGYCAMHGSDPRLTEFHVCYAAGNYTYPLSPIYKRYLIEFSREEIEKFWTNIVLKYKDKAIPEGV